MNNKRMRMFEIIRGAAAILVALLVASILIFICSDQPFNALKYMLVAPIISNGAISMNSIFTIMAAMTPIIFTGLAVCVMFSSNQFNMFGEGSVMLGGFIAALLGIYFSTGTYLDIVICVLGGAIVCAACMYIPAILKVKLGASEMVCSLMMNYIVMYVILHFLLNVFADGSKGTVQTFPFAETAHIPGLVPGGSKLSWGFVVALIFTVLVALFMYRTRWGYSIRMVGINQSFAKYSGMKVGGIVVLSQLIGGFLSGMGGAIEVLGRFDTFLWRDLPGYGWTGITVAILAKNNPIFVPIAAFFISYLNRGCTLMATYADVPAEMADIIQAVVFLFFAAEQFLAKYRQKLVVAGAKEEIAQKNAAVEGGKA